MSQDDTDNNRKLRQVLITYHSNIVVHDFTSFNIERACRACQMKNTISKITETMF